MQVPKQQVQPVHEQDADLVLLERKRTINWWYLTPVLFAPVFPIIRIVYRKDHATRNKLFGGMIALALVHGTLLISSSFESEQRQADQQNSHTSS